MTVLQQAHAAEGTEADKRAGKDAEAFKSGTYMHSSRPYGFLDGA